MRREKRSPPRAADVAGWGFVAGTYAGVLFALVSLIVYRSTTFHFTFGFGQAFQALLYTLVLHGALAGLAGAGVGLSTWALSRALPAVRGAAIWVLLLLPHCVLIPFLFASASWHVAQPRNIPMGDPYRMEFLVRSLLLCMPLGLLVAGVLVVVFHGRRFLWRTPRLHYAFAFLVLAGLGVTLAHRHLAPDPLRWRQARHGERSPGVSQVLLVGLDGATWRVVNPLLRAGRLPQLGKFMESASYGTLLVYGKPYSPAVWTSMVTGVKRWRHGILGHTVIERDLSVPAGSQHRKVPALWNILSDAGLTCGLINYMATYPPEHIRGVNMTRIVPVSSDAYAEKVWPPELADDVSAVVRSVPPVPHVEEHASQLGREVRILTRLFERYWDPSYSFFTVYTHSTDDAGHRYWSRFAPQEFGGTPFEAAAAESDPAAEVIGFLWEQIDSLFARLNDSVNDETVTLVVSDHGMEAASAPAVHLSINELLAELGLLVFQSDGSVDPGRSLAFWPPGAEVNLPVTGIKVNPAVFSGSVVVGDDSRAAARAYVMRELASIHLEAGRDPLFTSVLRPEEEPNPVYRQLLADADIVLHVSAQTRRSVPGRMLDLGERTIPLSQVLHVSTNISGAHHPRGIILAKGGPFEPGPHFARPTLETPVSDILQRMHGRSQRLDRWMDLARFLGILDSGTTLDIAPTVMYLLGLPVAMDMDGRVLAEAMHRDYVKAHPATSVSRYGDGPARPADAETLTPDQKPLERLRSLGYID